MPLDRERGQRKGPIFLLDSLVWNKSQLLLLPAWQSPSNTSLDLPCKVAIRHRLSLSNTNLLVPSDFLMVILALSFSLSAER
jgi:hypothetical protein